jgi:hypothetical protein
MTGYALAVGKPRIDLFNAVCILKGSNRVRKINALLAKVYGGFAIVPFIMHSGYSTGYRWRMQELPEWELPEWLPMSRFAARQGRGLLPPSL